MLLQPFERTFGSDDNTWVCVVEAILSKSHKGGIFLYQEDKLGISTDVGDTVNIRRDGLSTHTHTCAVNSITIVIELDPADDDSLLGSDNVQTASCTAYHTCHII